jgi:hypothetical protein
VALSVGTKVMGVLKARDLRWDVRGVRRESGDGSVDCAEGLWRVECVSEGIRML